MTSTTSNYSAVIFDDHKVFSESFSFFLQSLKIFQSIYCFTEEDELTSYFVKRNNSEKEFLFIDYYLPKKNGISVINDTRRLRRTVKIIVLSSVLNPLIILDIVQHKPDAFLSKSAGLDEILEAIRVIEDGGTYLSSNFQQIITEHKPISARFTDREKELLQYFAKGFTIEATAKAVFLSAHTVVAHRKKMMKKSNCNSILELLAQARELDLI